MSELKKLDDDDIIFKGWPGKDVTAFTFEGATKIYEALNAAIERINELEARVTELEPEEGCRKCAEDTATPNPKENERDE